MISFRVSKYKFIRIVSFNILALIIAIFLPMNSGGTGDIYEMSGIIDVYLILKCLILITMAIISLVYGIVRRNVSISAIFWIVFGVVIFFLNKTMGQPINPPEDPRSWDYNTIGGSIKILYIDCLIGWIYSIFMGMCLFRLKEKEDLDKRK